MDLLQLRVWLWCVLCTAVGNVFCIAETQITSLYACTDIKFRFATTRVTSHVVNPSHRSQSATFDITLPNNAFISNFTLEQDGKAYLGRVEERGQALRRYVLDGDFPKAEVGASAALVTQRPRETNRFRVTLTIGAGTAVTFNLTYQEILERRLGYYDHVLYVDPGQPVADMRVDVSIEEDREITFLHVPPVRRPNALTDFEDTELSKLVRVQRPSGNQAFVSYRPTPDSQQLQPGASGHGLSGLFTVRYDVNRSTDAGEVLSVNGYFVHFIAPQVREPVAKDVLFVLDTSTSMALIKLAQLQHALRVILADLAPGDRFALVQFNTRATFWRRELLPVTPVTIKLALEYVDTLRARGYTNIDSALEQGLQFFNDEPSIKGSNAIIIFLTDGRPTRGETDRNQILHNVLAQNRKKVGIYGLAFGKDADWPLVKRLASQHNGLGRRIYQDSDAALQIQGFYRELSSLLLTGVQAVYLDTEVDLHTLTRTLFRRYFNGSELVVAGKLVRHNQTALQVYVEATGAEGQVNLTLVPDPDPVIPGQVKSCGVMSARDVLEITEKMWAYLTLRQLLTRRVGESDEGKKEQLKEEAVQLALMHKFVTPVTSLVVTKPGSEDELALLQEDDSELLDETDVLGPENFTALLETKTTTGPPHVPSATTTTTTTTITVVASFPSSTSVGIRQSSSTIASVAGSVVDSARGIAPSADSISLGSVEATTGGVGVSTGSVGVSTGSVGVSTGSVGVSTGSVGVSTGSVGVSTGRTDDRESIAGSTERSADSSIDSGSTSVVSSKSLVTTSTSSSLVDSGSSSSRGNSSSDTSSFRGGGGGDPHFMIELTSLPFPLCFEVTGKPGDAFRLLKDPVSGLTVNIEIGLVHASPSNISASISSPSRARHYITRAVVLYRDVVADVTAGGARAKGVTLDWGREQALYEQAGVWLMMNNSSLRFALHSGVEVDVTRHVGSVVAAGQRGDFLNVEVQNEARLSPEATGLLGQFVHKDVRLQRIKRRDGRLVAELLVRNNGHGGSGNDVRRGRAELKTRRDPFFGRQASCLMVGSLWSHVLDRPARLYRLDSVFQT